MSGDVNESTDVFVHDQQTGETTRVSISSTGAEGNGNSSGSRISGDGRLIAFWSSASNLVPQDTNETTDVFVHDRETGETRRISVDSDGNQGAGDNTFESINYVVSISDDGRYVAFGSRANLVTGETGTGLRTYVHDLQTSQTYLVIRNCWEPSISADGRYVACTSLAAVFVNDRQTGETTQVSVNSAGVKGDGTSYGPSISGNGRFTAFQSVAVNLVEGDSNDHHDVFVHEMATGETLRVSVDSNGYQIAGDSLWPNISADGRFVVFLSDDLNGINGIFINDRLTGETNELTVNSDGEQPNGRSNARPSISADGRFVAFASRASNLVSHDTNGFADIFIRDRGQQAKAPASVVCGDLHPAGGGNGDVNVLDALRALNIAVGSVTPDSRELKAGDVHPALSDPAGDGDIDVLDALRILKESVGLVTSTSCGGP